MSARKQAIAAIATSNQRLNQDAQQIANPDNQNLTNPLLDAGQSLGLASRVDGAGAALIVTHQIAVGLYRANGDTEDLHVEYDLSLTDKRQGPSIVAEGSAPTRVEASRRAGLTGC